MARKFGVDFNLTDWQAHAKYSEFPLLILGIISRDIGTAQLAIFTSFIK